MGLKAYSNSLTDNYGLILNGYTGFNNSLTFYEQPGTMQAADLHIALPLVKSIPTNANAIQYWFIANSRRFIVVARTGTVYHQAYLGWMLPYGTPSQWPYPLVVGGSGICSTSIVPVKQNVSSAQVQAFWKPIDGIDSINGYSKNAGALAVKEPGGSYRRPILQSSGTGNSSCNGTWPYVEDTRGLLGGFLNMRDNLDNSYTLNPLIIVEGSPANMWGEFEGVKHVTGFGLTSEDLIAYRTAIIGYVCKTYSEPLTGDMVAYQLS